MTIAIYKNVPVVGLVRKSVRRKYPFEKMKVGDMLFVPGRQNFSSYASAVAKNLGVKFKTRRLWMKNGKPCSKDDGVFGTGVWRVQ